MKLVGNPYLLGLFIFIAEALINIPFGKNVISGLLLAFIGGMVYAAVRKEKISLSARLKATAVYMGLVIVISLVTVFGKTPLDLSTAFLIGGILFTLYGLLFFFSLWWGSFLHVKTEAKRQERLAKKAAEATPPPTA